MDGEELKEAIRETFEDCDTRFDDIAAFEDDFVGKELHQVRWKGGKCRYWNIFVFCRSSDKAAFIYISLKL